MVISDANEGRKDVVDATNRASDNSSVEIATSALSMYLFRARNLTDVLPEELLQKMAVFLDVNSLVKLAVSSKAFHSLVYNKMILWWRDISFGDLIPAKCAAAVSRRVLQFADFRSRLALSACSKMMRCYIFRHCSWMWVDVDFINMGNWDFRQNALPHLSDKQLRALLVNIDARQVTRNLSLRGCTAVTGLGLDPLRGSRALELIDLRLGSTDHCIPGETGLEEESILSILSSMPPFTVRVKDMLDPRQNCTKSMRGLSVVLFRAQNSDRRGLGSFNATLQSWLDNFHTIKALQIEMDRMKCDHCFVALAEKIPESCFENEASRSFCASCKSTSCGVGSCPTTGECDRCNAVFCESCTSVDWCSGCRLSLCSKCTFVAFCTDCNESFCTECRDVSECIVCERLRCEECVDKLYCISCGDCSCKSCSVMIKCHECELRFCPDCDETLTCNKCNERYCFECRIVSECIVCNKWSCESCVEKRYCESCCKSTCVDCQGLVICQECNLSFCPDCDKDVLSCCNTHFCAECKEQHHAHFPAQGKNSNNGTREECACNAAACEQWEHGCGVQASTMKS
mmetsp:Transcript_41715/g.126570  ORF Transcript_41715/g.126570 Transcript_41715/m.126570 type:complete len:573 (-) Transcript_41715:154-1872(-)